MKDYTITTTANSRKQLGKTEEILCKYGIPFSCTPSDHKITINNAALLKAKNNIPLSDRLSLMPELFAKINTCPLW